VRFYERQEIKDVIAYLRLLVNPNDDVSLLRIINTPARGIGKRALERVQAYAREHFQTVYEAVYQADQIVELGTAGQRNVARFAEILRTIETGGTLSEVIQSTLEKSGYLDALKANATPEDDARLENLDEFVSGAAEFEEREDEPTLDGFLETITLATDVDGLDSDAGTVTLMTLHGAKGLEFPVVFLTGMEEGLIPHQRSLVRESELEEERRLCYVGMTRAMTHLYLSRARVRRIHGEFQPSLRSRFLDDIPPTAVEEISPWPSADGFDGQSTRAYGSEKRPRATWRSGSAADETASRSVSTFDADSQVVGDDEVAFIRRNAQVTHPRFGDGTVTAVEGRGDNLRVTVRFDDGAEKSLLAAYAKLQPIDHEG
jgi:DNA helicase-2/ATP-dependent DNA helicase PcrA